MSTIQALVVGWRAARHATATRRELRAAKARTALTGLAEHGLAVAGLTCFTAAAAMVAIPLGLVVAGAGLFVLELRASS